MDEWKVLQWTVEYALISFTAGTLLLRLSFLMMTFWFRRQEFACIMYEMSTSSLPLRCMKACNARRIEHAEDHVNIQTFSFISWKHLGVIK